VLFKKLEKEETEMSINESITRMLHEWNAGDETALERFTPLVYDELRRRASVYLQRERDAETLQATVLVHEVFLQIHNLQKVEWKSRAHFINTVARMMRQILVDHARQRHAEKRNFGKPELPLSQAKQLSPKTDLNLVKLDEALQNFAEKFPRQSQVVELKFFGGLNSKEIAAVMQANDVEISVRTVERDWAFARAWLYERLLDI
jgi:RNA polymerase sigma factor (TIGR02999 family)